MADGGARSVGWVERSETQQPHLENPIFVDLWMNSRKNRSIKFPSSAEAEAFAEAKASPTPTEGWRAATGHLCPGGFNHERIQQIKNTIIWRILYDCCSRATGVKF